MSVEVRIFDETDEVLSYDEVPLNLHLIGRRLLLKDLAVPSDKLPPSDEQFLRLRSGRLRMTFRYEDGWTRDFKPGSFEIPPAAGPGEPLVVDFTPYVDLTPRLIIAIDGENVQTTYNCDIQCINPDIDQYSFSLKVLEAREGIETTSHHARIIRPEPRAEISVNTSAAQFEDLPAGKDLQFTVRQRQIIGFLWWH